MGSPGCRVWSNFGDDAAGGSSSNVNNDVNFCQQEQQMFQNTSPLKYEQCSGTDRASISSAGDKCMMQQQLSTASHGADFCPLTTTKTTTTLADEYIGAWPQLASSNATMAAGQPLVESNSYPVSYNRHEFGSALQKYEAPQPLPAPGRSSYTLPPSGIPHGIQLYGNDPPLVAPRMLHESDWDWFSLSNESHDNTHTSYGIQQGRSSLDLQSANFLSALPSSQTGYSYQNNYSSNPVSEPLLEWPIMDYNISFTSSSEGDSPNSSAMCYDANSSFGTDNFAGKIESNTSPLPALTYSEASPASEFEDMQSSCLIEKQQDQPQQAGNSGHDTDNDNLGQETDGSNSHHSALGNSRNHVSAINGVPSHAPNGTNCNPKEQRHQKDAFLVQCKEAGMSYRQIRARGDFTEAESTLRGRYRTLTKKREQRVRKPVWRHRDIKLLRDGVKAVVLQSMSHRMNSADVEVEDLNFDPNRVSWKTVAEYIIEHDGSYPFGYATCKKQWLRIQEQR